MRISCGEQSFQKHVFFALGDAHDLSGHRVQQVFQGGEVSSDERFPGHVAGLLDEPA